MQVQLPGPGSPEDPAGKIGPRIYRFRSQDEQTAISLTIDFFALSTERYIHWSEFAADLAFAYDAVQKIYRPAYATRVGLRYINKLTSENTGSQTKEELFGLLRPEITAMLQGEVWQEADSMLSQLAFLEAEATLNLRLAKEPGDSGLPTFLLDFDYFERGNMPLDDLITRCERYHRIIYDVFRWCILDESLKRFKVATQ
jgi:uncharacterized protein (TIGR04255 family)